MFRLSSRSNKRITAGIFGGATFGLFGGTGYSLQVRENTINAISQCLDYAVKKITELQPADLVDLLASPDNTKVPGTYFTVGDFKTAYAKACDLRGCVNLLANLSDVCQGKMNFQVTDLETGTEMGEFDVAGITQGALAIAIGEFKSQALAIADAGKTLVNPGTNGFFDSSIGQGLEKGADVIAKGSQVVISGSIFYAAEKIHDHFHANENGYFAYILCGIVSGAAAQKSQEYFARALSLVTTGQSALTSAGMGLAVHALSLIVQVGIRELEEPTIRASIKNGATSFINSATAFINGAIKLMSDNSKLLLTGAAVATVGVGVVAYANKK